MHSLYVIHMINKKPYNTHAQSIANTLRHIVETPLYGYDVRTSYK